LTPELKRDAGLLCLCLAADTMAENLSILGEYGRYADLLELQVDGLKSEERARAGRLVSATPLPVILTVRRKKEGGWFEGGESERSALLARLASEGFAYVDIEEDFSSASVEQAARAAGCRIIRSLHDMNAVPSDLGPRLSRLARGPSEIPKAAVTPRTTEELSRLFDVFSGARGMKKILLGMGELGFATRVLAPRLGSFLCYSSAPGRHAERGHMDPRTLTERYRFRSIGPDTSVYGVMGNPVMHSGSPLIHNAGFDALGIDAVYVPFLADDAPAFLRAAAGLGVRGLSVTVPFKQAVFPLCRADRVATRVGACNTLIREEEGWIGTNTDVEGFLAPLRESFGGSIPANLRASVIGAGGAARAAVFALTAEGAAVLVLNRTPFRARALAESFGARWAPLDEEGIVAMRGYGDLVVQTTVAGMEPKPEDDPLPGYVFDGHETVYDLVYDPPMTRFLSRAKDAGCGIVTGSRMLLAQAFAQFKLFTGTDYPGDLAPGLEERLSRRGSRAP
jgi:3-dehydroquinate dehydratase/shikimate dehydrogenase